MKESKIIRIQKRSDEDVYEMVGIGHCGGGQSALYGTFQSIEDAKKEFSTRFKGFNFELIIS